MIGGNTGLLAQIDPTVDPRPGLPGWPGAKNFRRKTVIESIPPRRIDFL
jgi:hypothetical protein